MHQRLPKTHQLLEQLRTRLRSFAWRQEIGLALLAACGWWLFSYGLDYFLHLPSPVRVLHTVVFALLPLWFLGFRLRRHLAQIPGTDGLAVLAERNQPESRDLLVTAVQFERLPQEAAPAGLPEILARAESRAANLSLDPVLDPRPSRNWLLRGAGALGLAGGVYALSVPTADIFVARMLGADVPWPQRTHLAIEIPGRADRMSVEETDTGIYVRLARGSDLPILVRAEGKVPSAVALHFDHGHQTVLESGGSNLFRTQLRAISQDVTFYATGGDDQDRRPEVHVEVLDPPDIGSLAFRVTPPPYSGQPPRTVWGNQVEVLAQSEIEVLVLPDPADVQAKVHLLPDGGETPLQVAAFPLEGGGEQPGLGMALKAEESLRLQFELLGSNGLRNPDPGLFAIEVLPDRRPSLTLLAPSRVDTEVVPGGLLPVRVRAQDDFGLSRVDLRIETIGNPGTLLLEQALTLADLSADETQGERGGLAHRLLAVDDLLANESGVEGQTVVVEITALDNREPDPQESHTSPTRVRVVSGDEFLRKLESRLAQAGDTAGKLNALVERLRGQLALLENSLQDDPQNLAQADLGTVLFDTERLTGDARELARDLAGHAEGFLYTRLDERAEALMRAMDQNLASQASRAFVPAPWIELADSYAAGRLGNADIGGDLVNLVRLALEVSEFQAPALTEALQNAGAPFNAEALALARQRLAAVTQTVDALVTHLGEWDNFQSVLTLTRDIIKRQRNLHERTRKFAKEQ
ncbi:MAG: hypothetical protein R3F33_17290 [Planctomycetota bacterium]